MIKLKKQKKILFLILVFIFLIICTILYTNYGNLKTLVSYNLAEPYTIALSENEQYIEDKQEYSETYKRYLQLSEEEKNELEIIPEKYDIPMSVLYTRSMQEAYNINQINEIEIPESFDLRDRINIKVENQGSSPICYSFASLTSVETNLALIHNDYVDLSEGHLAVNTFGNAGGGFISADSKYYKDKIGPVYQGEWSSNNPTNGEITAKRYVKKTTTLPTIDKSGIYNQEEIDTARRVIKKHIMEYGSLYASISSTLKKGDSNLYVLNAKFADFPDHAVSIIGWDDNFSKENFPISNRPGADGAYLALNSWGESWGDNGCFWISYEDAWVETTLRGVISVDTCQENMNIENIVITDKDNDTEISYKIARGTNAQVEINLNINEILNNKEQIEINVISPNGEDITNEVQLSGNQIENSKANILLGIDTSELSTGEYTIRLKYEDEMLEVPIKIRVETYDFKIKEDGSINITSYYGKDKKIIIPEEYFGYKVTGIEKEAFVNNDLESITIYENITEIGENIINESVIIYGNTETYVEQYATENGYMFIDLNETVIEGDGWYFEAEKNKLYIIENSSTKEYDYLKKIIKKVELKSPIQEIFTSQFEGYEYLEEVILPDSITSIGDKAFSECHNLKTINLPTNLNRIGEQAFYYCKNIEIINIPENVTTIGMGAFHSCMNLKNINIPDGVTLISDYMFYNCESLERINVPKGITKIGGFSFFKCVNLETVDIPESVTTIGDAAFYGCTGLIDFGIPSTITTMGFNIFNDSIINEIVDVEKTETELPDILKRALTKGDILDCGTGISVTNGKISTDKSKLEINPGYGQIIINISSGKLKGLKISVIVSGAIEYSEDNWTSEDVKATLYIGKGEYIINNNGQPVYTFSENGEFEFEYININGENKKATAKVENIDKTLPIITGAENINEQGIIDSINATISDEQAGLWSNSSIGYAWSTSNKTKPTDWVTVDLPKFTDETKQISFDIDITGMSGKYYLWFYKNAVYDMAANGYEKQWDLASEKPYYLGIVQQPLEIESEEYNLNLEELYISKIQPMTTVQKLKEQIKTNAEQVKITKENNEELTDEDIIGTGMMIELQLYNQIQSFTLVVKGDVNGDAQIKLSDMTKMNKYRLNKNTLEKFELLAGDVNEDDAVDFKDLVKINKYRLNKITEL